jgi:hypothetical protein
MPCESYHDLLTVEKIENSIMNSTRPNPQFANSIAQAVGVRATHGWALLRKFENSGDALGEHLRLSRLQLGEPIEDRHLACS